MKTPGQTSSREDWKNRLRLEKYEPGAEQLGLRFADPDSGGYEAELERRRQAAADSLARFNADVHFQFGQWDGEIELDEGWVEETALCERLERSPGVSLVRKIEEVTCQVCKDLYRLDMAKAAFMSLRIPLAAMNVVAARTVMSDELEEYNLLVKRKIIDPNAPQPWQEDIPFDESYDE